MQGYGWENQALIEHRYYSKDSSEDGKDWKLESRFISAAWREGPEVNLRKERPAPRDLPSRIDREKD